MIKLIHDILSSDKFDKVVRDQEPGYYDRQEKVFIPKKVVPQLVKEITWGPYSILGSDDLDAHFALCQVRIKRAIKNSLKDIKNNSYKQTLLRYISKEYLKLFSNSTLNFAALYVDLVGSTLMSMHLPSDKLATLIGIFSQEMSSVVSVHKGYVLKYAGDAVIAFFPETGSFSQMCSDALNCALDMKNILRYGINEVLTTHGFEPLSIRIGIEAGSNKIMLIGGDVDIIGYTMNIAAKITSLTKPNGINIGQKSYSSLDKKVQNDFIPLNLDKSFWKYQDSEGNPYKVYEYVIMEKDDYEPKMTKVEEYMPK